VIMGQQPCLPASGQAGLFRPSLRYVEHYQSEPPPNSMYTMGPMNGTKLMAAHRIFCTVDKSVRPAMLIQHSTTASGCNTIATAISKIPFTNQIPPWCTVRVRPQERTHDLLLRAGPPPFPAPASDGALSTPPAPACILHATANAHCPVPPAILPCRHFAFCML
jgi:hypothetical protein